MMWKAGADAALRPFVPVLYGLCTAALVVLAVAAVDLRETEVFRRATVDRQLDATRTKLEQALQDRLQLVRGLAAFVLSRDSFTEQEFLEFATALEAGQPGVRSLQLVPGGVVEYLTQEYRNKNVRGHDLLADPVRRPMVQEAIDRRKYVLAGPLDLVQGGEALIGRLPIFKADAAGTERFWGLATIVIDLQPLLEDAGMGTQDDGLVYAIRGKDGLGADGEIFVGEQRIFDVANVIKDVWLPAGSWQIAAIPNERGPGDWTGRSWFWWIGLALATVAGTMIWALARRPAELNRLIEKATQALRTSEERYKTLATVAPVGIFQVAGGNQLRFANEVWRDITGFKGQDHDSVEYRGVIHPDDVAWVTETWERLLADQEPFKIEYRFIKPGGREIWVLETAMYQATDDPDEPLIVGSLVDITARKNTEAELEASNAELEQFALIASHDLKAPLRAVRGYCSILQADYASKLDKDGQESIRLAIDGAMRMRHLIDDLHEFSRAGVRKQTIEVIRCSEVLDTVKNDLRFDIEDAGGEIVVGDLPSLAADRTDLTQIFQNLISNGLKYRSDQPPVITVEAEPAGDFWCMCVADNGIGIAPDQAETIFDVFTRLHARTRYPGSGLGLAICKKIVERNGGRVWLDTEHDTGARFCFTWPRETEAAA